MSEFTEQEFNEAMADLMGVTYVSLKNNIINYVTSGEWDFGSFTPCHDLNQLMPIVWKHGIDLDQELDGTWSAKGYINREWVMAGVLDIINDDPVEALRQCLWQIYKGQT